MQQQKLCKIDFSHCKIISLCLESFNPMMIMAWYNWQIQVGTGIII